MNKRLLYDRIWTSFNLLYDRKWFIVEQPVCASCPHVKQHQQMQFDADMAIDNWIPNWRCGRTVRASECKKKKRFTVKSMAWRNEWMTIVVSVNKRRCPNGMRSPHCIYALLWHARERPVSWLFIMGTNKNSLCVWKIQNENWYHNE